MVETHIIDRPLPPLELSDELGANGAELVFHGRVRRLEQGREITALHYEHYAPMASKMLQEIANEAAARFGISDLICYHRVGDVSVGQASLRTIIRSGHRAEALEAMAWFVSALKRSVPIWKWSVFADGEVTPCGLCSGCSEEVDHSHEEKQKEDRHAAIASP